MPVLATGTQSLNLLSPKLTPNEVHWRKLSSDSQKQEKPKNSADAGGDDPSKEIVMTPGEQVVAASRLTMWAGVFGFACVCAYYIGRELFPTKMSPNSVFNQAINKIRDHPQVQRQYGDSLKFYGKDHGSHREGRRNFIEHTEYIKLAFRDHLNDSSKYRLLSPFEIHNTCYMLHKGPSEPPLRDQLNL